MGPHYQTHVRLPKLRRRRRRKRKKQQLVLRRRQLRLKKQGWPEEQEGKITKLAHWKTTLSWVKMKSTPKRLTMQQKDKRRFLGSCHHHHHHHQQQQQRQQRQQVRAWEKEEV